MKIAVILIVAAVVIAGYFVLYFVSTAKHDPDVWHLDPLHARASGKPNTYRVAPLNLASQPVNQDAPVYRENPLVLSRAFDDFVLSQPNTVRMAGLPTSLMVTYVQTSKHLKMPDYITVKFIEVDADHSTIAIYSRSRFGYGDLGVNKRRVENWLKPLAAFETQTN